LEIEELGPSLPLNNSILFELKLVDDKLEEAVEEERR